MALISKFIIISLFFSLVYFVGLLTFITDYEPNNCEMTYMFEYPQFVKINMPNYERHMKYGLYAYSEGKFTERARSMKFDGIPVLFIPGNAGSFKQVRSLASVALRKALNSHSRYHFDFFTVDLNDELSGLNGALLETQGKFINETIQRVLSLYPKNKPNTPRSVILMGHSMGGVLAHSASVENEHVELLITMGSPHRSPSICLDWYTKKYYENLARRAGVKKGNQTFITIGAGNYDRLVNSWLTNANTSNINVVATAVPSVWLSMDHACIVWCKQLVLTVVRALFDSIDYNTKQLSPDHEFRLSAFKYHLLHNSGTGFQQAAKYRLPVRLEPKGEWREDIRRQYSILIPKNKPQVSYHMIRLFDDPKYQNVFIQAVNLQSSDWIFACTANLIQGQSKIWDFSDEAIHLSHRSEIVPSAKKFEKRKVFSFDLFRLKRRYPNITHVVVKSIPSSEPVLFNFDIHNLKDRFVSIDLPHSFSLSRKVIIKETLPEALRYVIEIPSFMHIMQTYLLYVEAVSCKSTAHQATARLHLPWAHHDSHIFITEGLRKPFVLRLHNSRPAHLNSTAKVILTLDPNCQYSVSIRSSIIGMLSQITRYYSPLLLANMAAVVLVTFYSQMLYISKERKCLNFHAALSLHTKPYYLVTIAKLSSRVLGFGVFNKIFPTPDGQYLINENMDYFLLPLLLYITAVGLTYLLSLILWTVLIVSESMVHRFVAKCVTRTFGGAIKLSDWFLNALHKVPCFVALTLLSLVMSTCGGIALCLGVVYYFLKLTHMCQEYLEGLVFRYLRKILFKFIGLFSRKKSKEISQELVLATTNETGNEQRDHDDQNQTENNGFELIPNKCSEENTEEESCDKKNIVNKDTELEKIMNMKENAENEDCNEIEKIEQKSKSSLEGNEENENQGKEICVESLPGCSKDTENDVRRRNNALVKAQENKEETESKPEEPRRGKKKIRHDTIHFHFSIFLIWLLVGVVSIPSVLTWAKNFNYNKTLQPDPSRIPGLILSICAVFLWQMEMPKPNKLYYKELGMFLYTLALLCLIYTPLSIYRLPYILAVGIVVVTLHQLFGPEESEEEEIEDPLAEPHPEDKIGDIKTKLE